MEHTDSLLYNEQQKMCEIRSSVSLGSSVSTFRRNVASSSRISERSEQNTRYCIHPRRPEQPAWWQYLTVCMMTVPEQPAWWQYLNILHDDSTWTACMMTVPEQPAWRQYLNSLHDSTLTACMMTVPEQPAWWQYINSLYDDSTWTVCMMTVPEQPAW